MSKEYDLYLQEHKTNVKKGFDWLKENLPHIIPTDDGIDYEYQIGFSHDVSKTNPEEYDAYDTYFYGENRSYAVVEAFNYAWLKHIHDNPHHWQYWVLQNDDPELGEHILEMPYNYIIEMVCDWWAFSWSKGNLTEIKNWYDEHKEYIKLGKHTREYVESIISQIIDKVEGTKTIDDFLEDTVEILGKATERLLQPYGITKDNIHEFKDRVESVIDCDCKYTRRAYFLDGKYIGTVRSHIDTDFEDLHAEFIVEVIYEDEER